MEAATAPPASPAAAEIDQSLEPEPAQSVGKSTHNLRSFVISESILRWLVSTVAELAALDARIGIDSSNEVGGGLDLLGAGSGLGLLGGMDASVEVAPEPEPALDMDEDDALL